MNDSLSLVSTKLASHCIVTVTTGTNFSYALPRTDVKTHFSLRFDGAYPLRIKGLQEQGEFVGFELDLTGHSEHEQLVLALESAAATLRRQAEEAARPAPAGDPLTRALSQQVKVDAVAETWQRVERAELEVLRLVALYGERALPTGKSVAQHLLHELRDAPLTSGGCAGLGELCAAAFADGRLPTADWSVRQWLHGQASAQGKVLLDEFAQGQKKFVRAEALTLRLGGKREVDQLPLACDQALMHLFVARIGVEQAQLLAEMVALGSGPAEENAELTGSLMELLRRIQDAKRREQAVCAQFEWPVAFASHEIFPRWTNG